MRNKKIRSFFCYLGCAAALGLGGSFFLPAGETGRVLAAESSVIEKLNITFEPAWGEPEEISVPQIDVSGNGVTLTEIEFSTDPEDWRPGKRVRVELDITADAGKYVPNSLSSSDCKVKGADFVSARAVDDRTLRVRADYIPVCVLGETEDAGWSDRDPGKAVWTHVRYAPGYTVTLYGNDRTVKKMTVTDNSADLGKYMKDPDKYYYYEVKAVPVTSRQKDYLKEGETVVSSERLYDEEELAVSPEHSYGEMGEGSIKGDHYIYPDGSRAVNTWKLADGKWYYFGSDGGRNRGWLNYGGLWYYMDGSGVMQTGWIQTGDGAWYYLNPDGSMATGWIQKSPDEWYYFNGNGRMQTGWQYINGSWYYFNPNGTMAMGWAQTSPGQWYYLNGDGRMHTGWLASGNGIWYYFHPDGRMATGWIQTADKTWYYLYGDGSMAANTTVDGWQIGPDGRAGKES